MTPRVRSGTQVAWLHPTCVMLVVFTKAACSGCIQEPASKKLMSSDLYGYLSSTIRGFPMEPEGDN